MMKWHTIERLRAWLSYGEFIAEVLFCPKMSEFLHVAFNLIKEHCSFFFLHSKTPVVLLLFCVCFADLIFWSSFS